VHELYQAGLPGAEPPTMQTFSGSLRRLPASESIATVTSNDTLWLIRAAPRIRRAERVAGATAFTPALPEPSAALTDSARSRLSAWLVASVPVASVRPTSSV
jgi:hypothetical protein